ncbi:hypothetical protein [Streptomyces sp. E-08]
MRIGAPPALREQGSVGAPNAVPLLFHPPAAPDAPPATTVPFLARAALHG